MTRVDVRDTDGNIVEIFPSAGAVYGRLGAVKGPFVWLAIRDLMPVIAVAHLTVEQAEQVRDALSEFIAEARTKVAASLPPPSTD
jgi:hypothetical protein